MASEPTQWTCGKCNYMNVGPICTHCGDVPTPDPRATVELLTRLDAAWLKPWRAAKSIGDIAESWEWHVITGPGDWMDCGDSTTLDECRADGIAALRNALPSIIHHLRRLVEVEAAAQAVCDPEVKRWSGVYSGEPWYSVPGELLTALANALAHREDQ